MPFNPYNPYMPNMNYGQPNYGSFQTYGQQQPQTMQQQNTYAFVNGIEGAKSYPVAPNQTVMLMDSESPIAYMKQANGMGQATLRYFKLVDTTEEEIRGKAQTPKTDYATKAEFNELKAIVEKLSQKGGEQ